MCTVLRKKKCEKSERVPDEDDEDETNLIAMDTAKTLTGDEIDNNRFDVAKESSQ